MAAIDWYFDFISPYAYLQFKLLERVAPASEIRPRPVLLAGILNARGQLGPAEIADKRRFTYRHVTWLAQTHGIAFQFPETHPFNPLFGLRLAVAAGCSHDAIGEIFSYVWRDGYDFEDANRRTALARRLSVEPERVGSPPVKQAVVENGRAALAAGVFGVPSLVIDRALFWGLDATEMAAAYLAGGLDLRASPYSDLDQIQPSARRI